MRKLPVSLTSSTRLQRSSVSSVRGTRSAPRASAALFTRISMRLNSANASDVRRISDLLVAAGEQEDLRPFFAPRERGRALGFSAIPMSQNGQNGHVLGHDYEFALNFSSGSADLLVVVCISHKVAKPDGTFRWLVLAGVCVAGLPVGAEVVRSVLQTLAQAIRAGVAGLAVTADTVGWVAQAGIQDLAVPQHAGLRGCTVQAGQRRGGIREHERKRREGVLSVGGGWCHGQVFLYDARGAVMTCIPLLGPESKGILCHARLGPPAIAARSPSSILFRIALRFQSCGVIHVMTAQRAEQRTNNDDDFYD